MNVKEMNYRLADLGKRKRSLVLGAGTGLIWIVLVAALTIVPSRSSMASEAIVSIAVFEFELVDGSAGNDVVNLDPVDVENLRKSTEQARQMLSASDHYNIVDTSSVADEVVDAGGVKHCQGCEASLARSLGAEQSMVGVISRVSRTEYTVHLRVRNAQTGAIVTEASTGLRMGANYSWPRGVKSLLRDSLLSAQDTK